MGTISNGGKELPSWVRVESTATSNKYIIEAPPINTTAATLQDQLLEVVYAALNTLTEQLPSDWYPIQADPDLVTKRISISMSIPIKASYSDGGELTIVAGNEFVETFSISSGK